MQRSPPHQKVAGALQWRVHRVALLGQLLHSYHSQQAIRATAWLQGFVHTHTHTHIFSGFHVECCRVASPLFKLRVVAPLPRPVLPRRTSAHPALPTFAIQNRIATQPHPSRWLRAHP